MFAIKLGKPHLPDAPTPEDMYFCFSKSLGLMDRDNITVVRWSPEWPAAFARLKDVYLRHLSELIKSIEHVGRTAVPGLDAKPVLDIDIIIGSDTSITKTIDILASLGYRHLGNRGIPGREAFERMDKRAPYDGQSTSWLAHNLYICQEHSVSFRNHLLLRDHLLADEGARKAYAALKHSLIVKDQHNRNAYVEGKTEL